MPYDDMRTVSLTGRPWHEFDRALIERAPKTVSYTHLVLIYRYRNIPYYDITYLHAVQDTRLSVNRYTTMYL